MVPIGITPRPPAPGGLTAQDIRKRVHGRQIVFALGRMIYYKGFEVLIEAARSLPEDCVVLIGGEGPLLAQHQARIEAAGLQHKVQLLGRISEADLPAYYEACDVFCLPSVARSEAYGVCMVEAMAAGKPVVATAIPGSGVPWVNVHGETGVNVRVGSREELAAGLAALLADRAWRERMGRAARERHVTSLTAESMVSGVWRVYDRR